MLCEQVLGKLHDFDTTGKTIEYVDIEWHEAFKKIHKKTTDKGTEVGIRMDDSILARGLYQDDVIYADDEKLVVVNTPPCEAFLCCFVQDELSGIGYHEILLEDTEFTSVIIAVIRIQEQCQVVKDVLFVKGNSIVNHGFICQINVK